MTTNPELTRDERRVERAILLQLLSRPDDRPWSLTVLRATLDHVPPSDFSAALARLEHHGVIVTESDGILASPCARRIEDLELIGQ